MKPDYSGFTAVIDLDDTLLDMRTTLMGVLNEHTGLDLHWKNWQSLTAEEVYGVSQKDFFKVTTEKKVIERMQPHPEAQRFLFNLKFRGLKVVLLTARSWHPNGAAVTKKFLRDQQLPYDELIVCDVESHKYEYITEQMGPVLFTVDDSVRHSNGFNAMEERRPHYVFGYSHPWNAGTWNEGVIEIGSLDDIGSHIQGL